MARDSRAVTGYATMLRDTAARFRDATAVVMDDARHSYGSLLRAGTDRARQLGALGLGPGDRVALLIPNCMEFIEILVGASMTGVVIVPVNTRFRAHELGHILRDSGVAAVFTTGAVDDHVNFKDLLAEALPGLTDNADPDALSIEGYPALRRIVHFGSGTPAWMIPADSLPVRAEGQPDPDPAAAPGPEDLQIILYTSGTTAAPKGCLLPNRCLVVTAQSTADLFAIGPEDGWWCPLPMFHIGGVLFMSVCLARGAKFVGMSRFNVTRAFAQFRDERPTVLYPLFPTILLPIMSDADFADTDFSRVRYVFDVGPEEIQKRIQAAFPDALLLSAYGMSETTGIVTFNHPDDSYEARMTTVGHFMPGWSARIIDPGTGQDVGLDAPGEIAVKGPALFAGYLNQPDLTASAHTPDGYFRTGDYGSMSKDGLLRFRGRLKDQMKVGGENVSALEVESFLAGHASIRMAQVVPIPDEKYGEIPAAFIECAPDCTLTADEVIAHCRGRIASFKVPRHVRFVSEWPMSATKVAKFKLQQQLIDELGLG
ncbi:class I adenylate-forming enzyme family protein [Mesobacterium pallidum]|uniref:class I adenylate-forming enzyme family protein n=1 Tax=Mesobacterium pallidum TaxID=2872037 RepID=UPI001EE25D72|nr:class I adenylate-forming enzyme family protein [Mesobacterium pallidum]